MMDLVETGESRTQPSQDVVVSNNRPYNPCQPSSDVLPPQPGSLQLFQGLLTRLIELGDIARQLSHNIDGNGYCPDEIRKLTDQLK